MPYTSIDYAILEKTSNAVVAPINLDWNDLGSWRAFYDNDKKDENNNVCIGDIVQQNNTECYFHSTGRLIACTGLDNIVVIDTPDAILVANKNNTEDVKSIVEKLQNRIEAAIHTKVYRPWGHYEILKCDSRFQVKKINVDPGSSLSSQYHIHRAEHWVIVSGVAKVTISEKETILEENQSIYINAREVHRLENVGKIPLILIETQTGSYLGEDDIIRIDDKYGRINKIITS